MPVIARFFGIVVQMHIKDHNPPHIHAACQNYKAAFDFNGKQIAGAMHPNARKLIVRWIKFNRNTLLMMWNSGDIFVIKN